MGANINYQHYNGTTPLIKTSGNGHLPVVQFLMDKKADHKIKNKMEETALTRAINNEKKEVETYLKILYRMKKI